jgi:hypothetical protein
MASVQEDIRELRKENHDEHRQIIELIGSLQTKTAVLESKFKTIKYIASAIIAVISGIVIRMVV